MIIAILLAIAAVVFMLWLLFTLAVYALPLFAGVSAGLWAYGAGAGPLGAIGLGLLAGVATLLIGQLLFMTVRSPIIRLAVALAFAAPAAVAGYHAVFGLAGLSGAAVGWREVFAWTGAVIIGAVAWGRIATSPLPAAAPLAPAGVQPSQP